MKTTNPGGQLPRKSNAAGDDSSLIPHPSFFFQKWTRLLAIPVFTAGLFLAFPPFNWAFTVLVFLVPFVLWAFEAPRWRKFLLAAAIASWLAWFVILFWLRHIYPPWGWVALTLLAAACSMFPVGWLAAARWAAPRMKDDAPWCSLAGVLGLAGLWIVFDWVRGWLFSGFLWLPLATAFWRWPFFLQLAAWTGQSGITFIIVAINTALAWCIRHRVLWKNALGRKPHAFESLQEAFAGPVATALAVLALIMFAGGPLLLHFELNASAPRTKPLLTVGVVQPWTPPLLKWTPEDQRENWNVLSNLTLTFKSGNIDAVIWPEAAPPFVLGWKSTDEGRKLLQQLTNAIDRPLLLGAVTQASSAAGALTGDYDGMLVINPVKGFEPQFYAKRHLVPFGEYVPLRSWLPFIGKVVPIDEDTIPGQTAETLPIILGDNTTIQAGGLVCYEDVFPELAADQVRAGADFIVVVTNDSWYGRGGGAIQHAAHSVLRAIETRRPVLRCGNDGWSGWIDETGFAYALVEKDATTGLQLENPVEGINGTTYFRGTGEFSIFRDPAYAGKQTFYVLFGNWFTGVGALLVILGEVCLSRVKTTP